MAVSMIARIGGAIVTIYMILCTLRIFTTWSPVFSNNSFSRFLSRVVDPFLGLFSGFSALKTGQFDFSPILAITLLSVLGNLFTTIAYTGRISLGIILGLLIAAAWSAVSFIISFMSVVALARIIMLAAKRGGNHPVVQIMDALLNPVFRSINRIIYRTKAVDYMQALVTGFIVLILIRAAGAACASLVVRLVQSFPF